ncbi:MAG: SAM-dependent chlorinase/fluorinase [Deltaproteobacteria bacterium]|nr:SAM-dependent chlorinase/fluorinase [Deltaproteobacteria bacterium]
MAIVTLLTDFGTRDAYVGVMKGVILSIGPTSTIVDITHHIDPQDVRQAAYTISASYKYFPKGTVHLIVVDPGVGSERTILAVEMAGHFFLAPDNGVLTPLLDEGKIEAIVSVDDSRFFLEPVSRTFHGRDIFAPAGAHIAMGVAVKDLGTLIDRKDLVRVDIPKPFVSDKGELIGAIVSFDRFGNLLSNIDSDHIAAFCGSDAENRLQILFRGDRINSLSGVYSEAEPMRPLAVIGSFGYLEISVNLGSARKHYAADKGDVVRVIKS